MIANGYIQISDFDMIQLVPFCNDMIETILKHDL